MSGSHQGYGFVEYASERDAEYAIKVANMIKLYNKALKVNKAASDKREIDVGANLFIGNLDPSVDEKLLYDTFSAFGLIIGTPKVMRDPDTGDSKGYGFVSFDCFEASDAAIDAMHNQYLCNRPISVNYALKKNSKHERHGDAAERMLAANAKRGSSSITASGGSASSRPHQHFASSMNQPAPSAPAAPEQPPPAAPPIAPGAAPAAPPPPPPSAAPPPPPVPPPGGTPPPPPPPPPASDGHDEQNPAQ